MENIEPLDNKLSEDLEGLQAFQEALLEAARLRLGIPGKYFNRTVICKKCNTVHVVPDGKDFVICCDEVINF